MASMVDGAELERPLIASITVDELHARVDVDGHPVSRTELQRWLVEGGYAVKVPGGLAPTEKTIQIAGAITS